MNIGLKRQVWGALGIGVALGAGIATRRETPSVLPAAQAAPEVASLRRASIEGEDVARLLRLQAYKWNYSLPAAPKGREISATYWIEDWRRNVGQPKIYSLGAIGLMEPKDTLMVKMPRAPQDEYVMATTGATGSGRVPGFIPISGSSAGDALDHQPIAFDRDIILIYTAHNASGSYKSNSQSTPGYERLNDRTVYLKVRFTTQQDAVQPVWRNGRIVLQ